MGTIAKKESREFKEDIGQDWVFRDNKIKHPDEMEWVGIEDWKRCQNCRETQERMKSGKKRRVCFKKKGMVKSVGYSWKIK